MKLRICLAAAALCTASAFAFLNFSPADDAVETEVESLVEIECGQELPLPGGYPVELNDMFLVKTFPIEADGSHEEAIAEFLANANAVYSALIRAAIDRAQDNGDLYPYVCRSCEAPNRCRVWATNWNPAPRAEFNPVELPGKIEIWATIVTAGSLTLSCTDC
jgi:hypothetical protein